MLRASFHAALEESRRLTVEMAHLTLSIVNFACAALQRADLPAGAHAMVGDDAADALQAQIESSCTEMLWKQQPLAAEFRQIAAMLDLSADLHRAAHNAAAVAKRVAKVERPKLLDKLPTIADLATLAQTLLGSVVAALESGNADPALDIASHDEEIEELYSASIKALQEYMTEHPNAIGDGTQLLFALASLRRVCKRSRNVATHVVDLIAASPAPFSN